MNINEYTEHTENGEVKRYTYKYLSFGDYDNSCHVERSNVRVFMERFKHLEGEVWSHRIGSYGSEYITFFIDPFTLEDTESDNLRELYETLCSLEDYTVLCDDDVSNMEREMIDEYLLFEREHDVKNLVGELIDNLTESEYLSFCYSVLETDSIYPIIEAGGNVYIDFDKIKPETAINCLHQTIKKRG